MNTSTQVPGAFLWPRCLECGERFPILPCIEGYVTCCSLACADAAAAKAPAGVSA